MTLEKWFFTFLVVVLVPIALVLVFTFWAVIFGWDQCSQMSNAVDACDKWFERP